MTSTQWWAVVRASDPVTDAATSSPVLVWLAIGIAAVVLVAAGWERISGPIYRALAARRRAASDKDDADILDLQRQVSNLKTWAEEKDARDREHAKWDRTAYNELVRLGADIEPPPPLF